MTEVPPDKCIVLQNTQSVILPAEIEFPLGHLAYWTPNRSQVIRAEAHVGPYLQSVQPELAKKLDQYTRQYSGVLQDQRKLVYLNFFVVHSNWDFDWATKPVDVDDGGDNYFHVFFDLKASAFEGLVINGQA